MAQRSSGVLIASRVLYPGIRGARFRVEQGDPRPYRMACSATTVPLFSDPNWPLRVTATEAAALGAFLPSPRFPAKRRRTEGRRFLAVVTRNFSTTEASFRKDQQILLESVQDYGKRGITLVNGQPVLLWLDNVQGSPRNSRRTKHRRSSSKWNQPAMAYPASKPTVSRRWFSRSSRRTPRDATRSLSLTPCSLPWPQGSSAVAPHSLTTDPVTGQQVVQRPDRVLTVTYTLNGSTKTRQAATGERLVLD